MTLEMAILHKTELERQIQLHAHDERLKWFHVAWVDLLARLNESNWNALEMVSMKDGRMIGYVEGTFRRTSNTVKSLAFVRWTEDSSLEWARDMARFIRLLFVHYGQYAVSWHVVVGSPHERSYDNLVRRLNGRIVGTSTGAAVLMDGSRHDRKYYELLAAQLDLQALDRMAGGPRCNTR